MDSKERRHNTLLHLLSTSDLRSQREVVEAMRSRGFNVTQPSISRDFVELGIAKAGRCYRPSTTIKTTPQLTGLITSIEALGTNLVVVKTSSAAANIVAELIDTAKLNGVVGTVAGENTIFVATKTKHAQIRLERYLTTSVLQQ
jgi:transcriptional regulator of arginine metabolism